jgi:hypothetical protein
MMKSIVSALVLLVHVAAAANDCEQVRLQSRDLRVKAVDTQYRLDLRLNGRWTELLTAEDEIIMPRLALERAEVAFLMRLQDVWSLQLMSLTGSSLQLGVLSAKPSQMCFDPSEQQLRLVSESELMTPLALPAVR